MRTRVAAKQKNYPNNNSYQKLSHVNILPKVFSLSLLRFQISVS